MAGSNILLALSLLLTTVASAQQLVREGKITYERKTNLLKQFDDDRMKQFLNDKNKIKIDDFSLYFNDSVSLFAYITPDQEDRMSWATMKNTVYQNYRTEQRTVFMDMFGTALILSDSTVNRQWKITDKTRKIAGYDCTRAIWQKDDSTRIYAWFTTDIVPTVGPESVQGLPGAILGLATEDGGIVYFAKSVDLVTPTQEQVTAPKKKGKEYTEAGLRTEMTEKMKGQPFGDKVLRGLFFW